MKLATGLPNEGYTSEKGMTIDGREVTHRCSIIAMRAGCPRQQFYKGEYEPKSESSRRLATTPQRQAYHSLMLPSGPTKPFGAHALATLATCLTSSSSTSIPNPTPFNPST